MSFHVPIQVQAPWPELGDRTLKVSSHPLCRGRSGRELSAPDTRFAAPDPDSAPAPAPDPARIPDAAW